MDFSYIIIELITKKLTKNFGDTKILIWLGAFIAFLVALPALYIFAIMTKHEHVENYYKTKLYYNKCYYQKIHHESWLVLENRNEKYSLNHNLWFDTYEITFVTQQLNRTNNCIVWLESKKSKQIRGILAEGFHVDPQHGAKVNNSQRRKLIIISIIFFTFGLSSILMGIYLNKKQRKLLVIEHK
jgi:hypothetical protein